MSVQAHFLHICFVCGSVSIHPMCRFKCQSGKDCFSFNAGFNTSNVSVQANTACAIALSFCSFNTSNVSVQALRSVPRTESPRFQYIQCVGSRLLIFYVSVINQVSIHPMCRFKSSGCSSLIFRTFVSIHPMCRFKQLKAMQEQLNASFNTSNVSVQAYLQDISCQVLFGFNTSNVSVQEK